MACHGHNQVTILGISNSSAPESFFVLSVSPAQGYKKPKQVPWHQMFMTQKATGQIFYLFKRFLSPFSMCSKCLEQNLKKLKHIHIIIKALKQFTAQDTASHSIKCSFNYVHLTIKSSAKQVRFSFLFKCQEVSTQTHFFWETVP